MSEKKNFIKDNAKWIAIIALVVVAALLVVFLLKDDTSNVNKDKDKNNTNVESNQNDKDDADENEEDDKEVPNYVTEDGVQAVEIGLVYGNTKYDNGMGEVTYDEDGVIIYESIREEEFNLFFNTGGGEFDTISQQHEMLWKWEEGGIYVNNYRENVPLVKYNAKAYYIYFAFDGNATVKPEKGMRVSIQGTLIDDNGGKAKFLPVTYEYQGGKIWKIVSRKAIVPQEKPAEHTTVKITGWDDKRIDRNLFFTIEDNCSVKSTLTPLWSWTQGGIYMDGERVSVSVVKHSSTGYYVYFGMDNFATVAPVKGTRIGIQGTLSDGKNTTTFEPATFEYQDNGIWKLVSREQVIPMSDIRPQPKPGEKEIYIYSSARKDTVLFFETSSNDTFEYNADWICRAWATEDENSGVFVNNVKKNASLTKHAANEYLIYWPDAGIEVEEGMKVSIQGDFVMGEKKHTYHPATFEYKGNGKWTLISREAITPEAEKPGPIVTVTADWDSAHADASNIFFVTDKKDSINKIGALISTWIDGGIYIDGQKAWSHFYKHSANGYCVYLSQSNVTVVEGMKVSLQGTLSDGFNAVTINPVTFEYKGNKIWEVVSRESITPAPEADRPEPEEGEKEAYIYEISSRDTTLWFETSTNDTVPASDQWTYKYWAKEGGLYINGVKKDIPLIKVGENKYIVHESFGFTAVEGMKIHIQGTFWDGTNEVTLHPATFEYDGAYWKLISRDEMEESGETVLEVDTAESRTDNVFVIASKKNDIIQGGLIEGDKWTDGGVYIDGVKSVIHIAKYAPTKYYIYLEMANITPVEGMKVGVQGVYNDGTVTIEFAPVTFQFTNGAWVVVSREAVEEKTVFSINSSDNRKTEIMMTTTVANSIPNGAIWGNEMAQWLEGGIYVNGVKQWCRIFKYAGLDYYIDTKDLGVELVDGITVSVQGKYQYSSEVTIDIAPVTFEYDADTETWIVVSREWIEEPEEELVVTLEGVPSDRAADSNALFFATSADDELPADSSNIWWWKEGGLTLDGTSINGQVPLIKWSAKNYYVYFAANPTLKATIKPGSKVVINGTLQNADGSITVKINPENYIFVWSGTNWYMVEEVTPALNVTMGDRFTVTPADSLVHDPSQAGAWDYTYWPRYVGIQVKTAGASEWTAACDGIIKFKSNEYLMRGLVAKSDGMLLKIGGIYDNTNLVAKSGVYINEVIYRYDAANNVWVEVEEEEPGMVLTFDQASMISFGNWYDNILLKAPEDNSIAIGGTYYPSWQGDGGIYIDGVRKEVAFVKYTAKGYYINLNHPTTKYPVYDNMKVTIKGKCSINGVELNFAPLTLQFDASDKTISTTGSWKVVTQ